MLHFTVDDNTAMDAMCQKCCCEKIALKPGTITKLSVGYASWAVPIGKLHCAPQFQIEQLATCPTPTVGNLPPQITAQDGMARFDTGTNVHLDGDLRTKVTDPEGTVLIFKLNTLYGPKHGKLVLDSTGMFDYDPAFNFKGEERFYVTASDGANMFTFETMIAVGIDAGLMSPEPHVSVGPPTVDNRYFTVSFPVVVTPAANECEVWKLTVLQTALDCACTCFARTDCFDISVTAC